MHTARFRTPRRFPAAGAALLACAVCCGAGSAGAAPNDGASATLTWSALDPAATDLTTGSGSATLFVRLVGAASFKGAEINLTWAPAGDPAGACFAHVGSQFRTSTDCTYLNRGIALPVTVADEAGHLDLAWANTTTRTDCAAGGVAVSLDFAFDGCPTTAGCFTLVSMKVIDEQNLQTSVDVAAARATVFGGACDTQLPPRIDPIDDQSVYIGDLLSVVPTASDPEGEPLSFAAENLPAGATCDVATGEVRWTPGAGQQGTYDGVALTATDPAGLTGTATFGIRVPNRAPVVGEVSPQEVEVGGELVLPIVAFDADGDSLQFSSSPLPLGASLSPDGVLTWAPPIHGTVLGAMLVTVTADDGRGGAGATAFALIAIDTAPTLEAIGDTTMAEGDSIGWDLVASDPTPGDTLRYSLAEWPSGATLDGTRVTYRPSHASPRVVTFTAHVRDIFDALASETWNVTVTNVPHARYVDPTAPCDAGGCDGESWATAYGSLQEGTSSAGAGDSVLVAEGLYVTSNFGVYGGVRVEGGYAAGGGERDIVGHRTVLRAAPPIYDAYVALTGPGAVVDGVAITGARQARAVVRIDSAGCVLRDVTLTDNTVAAGYAALAIGGGAQGTVLDRVAVVRTRSAGALGCVSVAAGASVEMDDCTIAADSSRAMRGTPGIACNGTLHGRNILVWGVAPRSLPAVLVGSTGSASFTTSDIAGGWSGSGNIDADPLFCDVAARDCSVRPGSPCIGGGHDGSTIGAFDAGCGRSSTWPPLPDDDAWENEDGALSASPSPHAAFRNSLGVVGTPARNRTAFSVECESPGRQRLDIFTASGAFVRRLLDDALGAGRHEVAWDGRNAAGHAVAPGLYVARLSGTGIATRRVLLLP